jgi:hypothetical protein
VPAWAYKESEKKPMAASGQARFFFMPFKTIPNAPGAKAHYNSILLFGFFG